MRIGIDARPALFTRTGIGRYVAELVRALAPLCDGHELLLYGDAWRAPLDGTVARLRLLPNARFVRRRFPARAARLLARFGWLGCAADRRLGGVDVFQHTDLVYAPVGRAKTIVTIHDLAFEIDPSFHDEDFRRSVGSRLRRAVAYASLVIVPSRATADAVAERLGVPAAKIRVTPYGGDHLRAEEAASDADVARLLRERGVDGRYILCVGTIEPRKNHDRLLTAFERVARVRDVSLVLVGAFGWLCDEVRRTLEDLRARRARVLHLPDLDDRWLLGLYRGAAVNAYLSLYEGFGLPVAEGFAAGVPTLTSGRGALAEVAGGAALLADPEDVAAIEAALLALLDDETLRRDLAARGRRRAERFTWQACARLHLDAYQEVLA